MSVEFTIYKVPQEAPTAQMPFFGLATSEVVLDVRHPDSKYYELMDSLRFFQGQEDYLEITPVDLKKATGDDLPELSGVHKYVCCLV